MYKTSVPKDTLIYVDRDYISKGYICYHFEEHVTYAGKILDEFMVILPEDAEAHNLTLCPKCAKLKQKAGGDSREKKE